jgi:hypothetical protein
MRKLRIALIAVIGILSLAAFKTATPELEDSRMLCMRRCLQKP